MAEATPVPNARLSGSKRKKVPGVVDAWLQQLAQEIVHEHTSQALTPANVQASLQLLLTKDAGHCRRATLLRSQRRGGIMV
ncbi:hypothetical protein WJX77_001662 [Trebouxia sp. C0004]